MAVSRDITEPRSTSLPLADLSDHHIHTQSLSSAIPDKLHLRYPTFHPSSNGASFIASASPVSALYLVRIVAPNPPGQRRPPPDVLMHIRASLHEGVTDVLHHYFGEVYQNSSCTHCTSVGGTQAPQFAIVILPYYPDPSLSHYMDTNFFDTHPALSVLAFSHLADLFLFLNEHHVSFGGAFASYVLVNPADGGVKVHNFAFAVEVQDTHDLRTLGNMFTTIFYHVATASGPTNSVRGPVATGTPEDEERIFMQASCLARMLQFFEQSHSSNAWSSLRALQGSMYTANAPNEQLSSNGSTIDIGDDSDILSD
ncbi:hypothetical protein BDQ17DRAFT_1358747 [Cyathus striatus]|nr:hypothetical protein BDQ17DRAFT_1358747 [Cyathus striatus]